SRGFKREQRGPEVRHAALGNAPLGAAHPTYIQPTGFSAWPPNCLRIAESTWLAKWSRSREPKREKSALESTGAGTPSSIAAIAVQRPSPESETRPEKSFRSGDSNRAAAERSSSHDAITLPRRH